MPATCRTWYGIAVQLVLAEDGLSAAPARVAIAKCSR